MRPKTGLLLFWTLAIVVILDLLFSVAFAKAMQANRVSPTTGALFYYGRGLLLQVVLILFSIVCWSHLFSYFRVHGRGVVVAGLFTAMSVVVVYTLSGFVLSCFFMFVDYLLSSMMSLK
jgi:hypothetical protein